SYYCPSKRRIYNRKNCERFNEKFCVSFSAKKDSTWSSLPPFILCFYASTSSYCILTSHGIPAAFLALLPIQQESVRREAFRKRNLSVDLVVSAVPPIEHGFPTHEIYLTLHLLAPMDPELERD